MPMNFPSRKKRDFSEYLGRRPWIATFAFLGAALGWLAWARLSSTTPPPTAVVDLDIREYFLPSVEFTRRTLLSGELPLWNPDSLAGLPFAATLQPAVYYPLLTPLLVFPPPVALSVHLFLHLWLAGVSTWCLARELGLSSIAAAGSAFAFTFSAPLLHAVFNTAMLSSSIWLPAIFWALLRCRTRGTSRSVGLLAITCAAAFLAGHPQLFVYTAEASVVFAFWLAIRRVPAVPRPRYIVSIAIAGLLAALLVAVQALPTIELASGTVRPTDAMVANATNPWAGVTAIPLLDSRPGGELVGLPLFFLPLAGLALLGGSMRRSAGMFLVLFLLALDMMRGPGGLGFEFYSRLPLAALFRFPERMAFVASFAGAMLIGLGLHFLTGTTRLTSRGRFVTATLLALGMVLDAYATNSPEYHYLPLAKPSAVRPIPELSEFAASRPMGERYFVEDFYQSSLLPSQSAGPMRGVPILEAYEPLLPREYAAVFGVAPNTFWTGQLTLLDVKNPDLQRQYRQQSSSLFDRFSVRYYVDGKSAEGTANRAMASKLAPDTPSQRIPFIAWERRSALPRAYLVHEIVAVKDRDEAIRRLREGTFDSTSQVLLPEAEATSSSVGLATSEGSESAEIVSLTANRMTLSVEAAASAILVVTDLHFPGWKVRVDGIETPILAANGLFRGVRLESGRHRIEFEYHPASHRWGAALTMLGLCVLLALLFARNPSKALGKEQPITD